jgi:hypothetical protein
MQFLIKQDPRAVHHRREITGMQDHPEPIYTVAMNQRFEEINRSPETPFLEASTLSFQDHAEQGFHGSGGQRETRHEEKDAFEHLLLTEVEKARSFGFN